MIAPFDADKHDLGLGYTDDDLLGFITSGAYGKRLLSPTFQSPAQLGVDSLIGIPRFSMWTQRDYTGGEFAYDWRKDDQAQFSDCSGMQPDQLSRSLRTCRPVVPESIGVASALTYPMSMDVVGDRICVVYRNSLNVARILAYQPATAKSTWNNINGLASGSWPYITAAAWNQATETLWLAVPFNGSTTNKIWTYRFDSDGILVKQAEILGPVDTPIVTKIKKMHLFGQVRLLIGESQAPGDNDVVYQYAGGTTWDKVGRIPGEVVDTATYNNSTYLLSRSPGARSFLSMTDGSDIFPVYTFPFSFKAYRMVEYGGRLYIIGTGADANDKDVYGELYEVNGTSARLVRTFAPETGRPDPTNASIITLPNDAPIRLELGTGTHIHIDPEDLEELKERRRTLRTATSISVFEGLLYIPDDSTGGLEIYDYTTDSFYGGPILARQFALDNLSFTDGVSFGNHLYLWGASNLEAKTGLYRTVGGTDTSIHFDAYLSTSDFAPEPARDKIWGDVVVLTRYKFPSLMVSTDSGLTWQHVTSRSVREQGYRFESRWTLSGIEPSRSIRLKFVFRMVGDADEQMGELIAHTLSYLVREDPRFSWQFTIPVVTQISNDPNRPPTKQDLNAMLQTIWTWSTWGRPIRFRDIDGQTYSVLLSCEQRNAVIDQQGETFLQVTLTEV